ncbi:hypothetical protein MBLNU230_g0007t1 [Neophaeotheca triangularis]
MSNRQARNITFPSSMAGGAPDNPSTPTQPTTPRWGAEIVDLTGDEHDPTTAAPSQQGAPTRFQSIRGRAPHGSLKSARFELGDFELTDEEILNLSPRKIGYKTLLQLYRRNCIDEIVKKINARSVPTKNVEVNNTQMSSRMKQSFLGEAQYLLDRRIPHDPKYSGWHHQLLEEVSDERQKHGLPRIYIKPVILQPGDPIPDPLEEALKAALESNPPPPSPSPTPAPSSSTSRKRPAIEPPPASSPVVEKRQRFLSTSSITPSTPSVASPQLPLGPNSPSVEYHRQTATPWSPSTPSTRMGKMGLNPDAAPFEGQKASTQARGKSLVRDANPFNDNASAAPPITGQRGTPVPIRTRSNLSTAPPISGEQRAPFPSGSWDPSWNAPPIQGRPHWIRPFGTPRPLTNFPEQPEPSAPQGETAANQPHWTHRFGTPRPLTNFPAQPEPSAPQGETAANQPQFFREVEPKSHDDSLPQQIPKAKHPFSKKARLCLASSPGQTAQPHYTSTRLCRADTAAANPANPALPHPPRFTKSRIIYAAPYEELDRKAAIEAKIQRAKTHGTQEQLQLVLQNTINEAFNEHLPPHLEQYRRRIWTAEDFFGED